MKEDIEMRDKESQEELAQQQEEVARTMRRLQAQQEELKITVEKLHREKYEALEANMAKHRKDNETKNKQKEAEWAKEKEELNGQVTLLTRHFMKSVASPGGQSIVEPTATGLAAWGRTVSLTLRGNEWAFIGPYRKAWYVKYLEFFIILFIAATCIIDIFICTTGMLRKR